MSRHGWSVAVFHHYSFPQPGNVLTTSSTFLKLQIYLQIVRLIFFCFHPLFFFTFQAIRIALSVPSFMMPPADFPCGMYQWMILWKVHILNYSCTKLTMSLHNLEFFISQPSRFVQYFLRFPLLFSDQRFGTPPAGFYASNRLFQYPHLNRF